MEQERHKRLQQLKNEDEEEAKRAKLRLASRKNEIHYQQDLQQKEFKLNRKSKSKKKRSSPGGDNDAIDWDELMEERSNQEEEEGDYKVQWVRLKVPLAAQSSMDVKEMVERGGAVG